VEYFTLNHPEVLPEPWQPAFDRTQRLIAAIHANPDFDLLEVRCRTENGEVRSESLVIEVICDGVPPGNRPGVLYRERLGLVVSENERLLIDVRTLRKDFPGLIHMNATHPGEPWSLCLYFEPPATVLREWTPQRFLRRIQWWLTQSSREDLHTSDQPLEQVFFMTPYTLVLPWNFDQLAPDTKYQVRAEGRPGGLTILLHARPDSESQPAGNSFTVVTVETPPIVQGQPERLPACLGELVDQMLNRKVDVFTALSNSLREGVDTAGIRAGGPLQRLILLLRTPVTRTVGSVQERVQTKAFIFESDRRQLGTALGAYLPNVEGVYYANLLGLPNHGPGETWRDERILAAEIIQFNDQSKSRLQSGLTAEGPRAVMIGAGSLGSAMLNIWNRCGWGNWTVIDNDHIKPHNLVRHTAYAMHVGMPKVDVVTQLWDAVSMGASAVTPINADAATLSEEVLLPLRDATLVVDASADLSYPRAASKVEQVGRHVSTFFTPDGNAAVMLAEDSAREVRLTSLEAQYYRAMINAPWGVNHLNGHLGTYWSGASCRDISMALPYSRVLAHAACLAEQVQSVMEHSDPMIRVWSRDPSSGVVELHSVVPEPSRAIVHGGAPYYLTQGWSKNSGSYALIICLKSLEAYCWATMTKSKR